MKKLSLPILVCVLLICQGCCWNGDCPDDVVDTFESNYDAVYMPRAEFEESVTLSAPKPIVEPGKIYVFRDLLFINEKHQGFHVYANSNPEQPEPLNFINTPGGTDVSIKDGVFYINQAVDLIAITFDANVNSLNVSKRIRNIFPVLTSPEGYYPINASEENIAINWTPKN